MCGISGIVDPERRLSPIASMNQIQRHRGPDDEGYLFVNTRSKSWRVAAGDDTGPGSNWIHHDSVPLADFDLVLGSRRLAVLDLTPVGRMPMPFDNGALWVTYNGEIYNYRELREELRAGGYRFSSGTDTEVILAAYDAWGPDCVSRFNGMFAFALWDSRRRQLFCARDHFGIKPFYYHWNGSTFVFASEIKALLQHPVVPRVPDQQSIFDYLILGMCDHEERTFFDGIRPLEAAHTLTLDVSSGRLVTRRWWQAAINPAVGGENGNDEKTRSAEFRDLLEDAIRLRLRSDVPVGTCLSGGLDSSAITCLANRLLLEEQVIPSALVGEHQKTFTARNREVEIDEYQYSHLVVEQTGAEEHTVFVNGERLWQEIEAFAWHMDQPFSSTSQYPQWNVMRLAREQGVTVLLDGQGGDELLGGYYSYLPLYVKQVAQQVGWTAGLQAGWQACQVGGAPVFDVLYQDFSARLPWRLQQALRALRPVRSGPGTGGSGLTDSQLTPEFAEQYRSRMWRPPVVDGDGLAGVLYRDLMSTNLPMLLRYEDRNSMAFSIESRLPFLDPRLVELAFSLPLDYRIRDGWTKWILRRSLRDTLPPSICWRRSKLGFPTPEQRWLAQGGSYIRRLLGSDRASQLSAFVNPEALARVLQQSDDELAATPGLWRIVNLALWFDLYFNRSVTASPLSLSHSRVA